MNSKKIKLFSRSKKKSKACKFSLWTKKRLFFMIQLELCCRRDDRYGFISFYFRSVLYSAFLHSVLFRSVPLLIRSIPVLIRSAVLLHSCYLMFSFFFPFFTGWMLKIQCRLCHNWIAFFSELWIYYRCLCNVLRLTGSSV